MQGKTQKQSRKTRFLILLLCAVFVFGGPAHPFATLASSSAVTQGSSSSYQSQIDEINSKLDALANEKAALESSLKDAQSEKQSAQAQYNYIDQQISLTRDEITELLGKIELLEMAITEKQLEIELKQADIDEKYDLFLKRLRAMYMYDDATMLGLVLGADSFSEFLTHTDTVIRIAEHDRNLMEELTVERTAMEEERANLEAQMDDLEDSRVELEGKRSELDGQLAAANLEIEDLERMEREYLADLEKNKALQAAFQSELTEIYNRIKWDESPYVGGEMAWPLPGYYKISSEYGYRFQGSDFHSGIDLTGTSVYGADIVAANAGTVKFTNWSYTPGVGYGIYVIVDHGGGITTLYGHCSSLSVQVGDVVERGQTIASVGSTGWSTGPHLHFEVRIDGSHVNPKPYIIGNA